jgi:hypothetical protein
MPTSFEQAVAEIEEAQCGEGLGAYVGNKFRRSIGQGLSERANRVLKSSIVELEKIIERACPVVLGMGFVGGYGLVNLEPGLVYIAVANRKYAIGVGTSLADDIPAMPPDLDSGHFWGGISDVIDNANTDKKSPKKHAIAVADAILVKAGPTVGNVRFMAQDLQEAGAPYVMMIAGICGRDDDVATGALMALMMPAIFMPDGSCRAA